MQRQVAAIRWVGWALPLAVFVAYFGPELLDIRRVYPLLYQDWASYAASQNFVRSSPAVSFPIGELPDLLHPAGTSLGQVDAWPVLFPVYRMVSAALPNQAFQLIGWQLLAAMTATFGLSRCYLRGEVARLGRDPRVVELLATAGAVTLIVQPFYLERRIHPSLFNAWVIIWALLVATRELRRRAALSATVPGRTLVTVTGSVAGSSDDVLGGDAETEPRTDTLHGPVRGIGDAGEADGGERSPNGVGIGAVAAYVAPAIVAAALMPYLAMLALGVLCLPLLFTVRADPRGTVWRIAVAFAGTAVVAWVLGFVGGGGRTSGIGYGLFNADLALLFDSKQLSRVWPDLPASYTHEGLGFLGTPLLILVAVAVVTHLIGAGRRRGSGREHLRPLWAAVLLMFVYATLPVVRFARHDLVDLTAVTDLLGPLTGITRSSGRFAWPLLWLAGLTALGFAARLRPRVALAVTGAIVVLQLADSRPPPPLEVADQGAEAEAVIRTARGEGAAHLEFQPPFVATDCTTGWSDFADVAALTIAAGAAGMTVNSGYPSRGSDRFADMICGDQADDFTAGRYRADVLYAVPFDRAPSDPALDCRPTTLRLLVCRAQSG